MKICRFDDDRLGLVLENHTVLDVTSALEILPVIKWPVPLGDALIYNLDAITSEIQKLAPNANPVSLNNITLKNFIKYYKIK